MLSNCLVEIARHYSSRGKTTQQVLKRSTSSVSQSLSTGENWEDLKTLQLAEDATISSKMFDAMGNLKRAIEVNNDILTMFKKEGDYNCDVGFTSAEINGFGPKTLKMVVSTLISNARRLGDLSFRSSPEEKKREETTCPEVKQE